MKKFFLSMLVGSAILLTGCLETTQEITVNEDGTASYAYTSDMSAVMGMVKSMGMADNEMIPKTAIDTTVLMADKADSVADLSAEEKAVLKNAAVHFNFDMGNEKFFTKMNVPLSSLDDVKKMGKITSKIGAEIMKTQMPKGMAGMQGMGDREMPPPSSVDDYYKLEFSKDEISRKLNKDKYAAVGNDEMLNGMKQATAMGVPVNTTYIINLPRPAEKAEGKNVKLSEDKKKVTITTSLDDFFDNPESLEFKVKY